MSIKRLKRLIKEYTIVHNFCVSANRVGLRSAASIAWELKQIIEFIQMKLITNTNKYYVVF